ncbi:MAG: ATP-dependent Clp protease ATP-binding subunit, partial [Lentisphaerae bacterium]|nr:ATP-dependent Clp protease ATP-binding subunit [Lentisphaerota bacterium]
LFDEIEKAHPDVMNILLQLLEEGLLTDSLGRRVNFRNTIVILTSNLGADFTKTTGGLGFGGGKSEADYERLKGRLLDEAKKVFRPELLNRVDDQIVFRQLSRDDVVRILELEVAKIMARMDREKSVSISLSDEAKTFLIEKGFDQANGARPLRRTVERYIQDPLAEEILAGHINAAEPVTVGLGEKGLTFKQAADVKAK